MSSYIFTSESVSEGHPDKICDRISDAILDAYLAKDPHARVACETATTTDFVMNLGEIKASNWESVNTEDIARRVVRDIGYDSKDYYFCYNTFKYKSLLHAQSQDISAGVDKKSGELGAGDQGMMFGYATDENQDNMPLPISLSNRIVRHFSKLRKSKEISFLRPDAKSQVSVRYEDDKPVGISSIVLSHQTDDIDVDIIEQTLQEELKKLLGDTGLLLDSTKYYINPTKKFVIGGPHGDAGLTGRKIIVDTYGGMGRHGGGAFSGKDPSKVDRSSAYFARYAAKNIVAAGLAQRCEIQVSYAIGVAEPISININSYGTSLVKDGLLERMLQDTNIFDFRPASIIKQLNLTRPSGWSYEETANYGHFSNKAFPWEQLDKVEELRDHFSLSIEKQALNQK